MFVAFYGPLYYYVNLFQVIAIQQYGLTQRIEDIETSRRMYRRNVKQYVDKIHLLTRQSAKLMSILSDPTFYGIILGAAFFSYFISTYVLILFNLLMYNTEKDSKTSVHFTYLAIFYTFLALYLLRTFFSLIRELSQIKM